MTGIRMSAVEEHRASRNVLCALTGLSITIIMANAWGRLGWRGFAQLVPAEGGPSESSLCMRGQHQSLAYLPVPSSPFALLEVALPESQRICPSPDARGVFMTGRTVHDGRPGGQLSRSAAVRGRRDRASRRAQQPEAQKQGPLGRGKVERQTSGWMRGRIDVSWRSQHVS
jgi:hypothetical protein